MDNNIFFNSPVIRKNTPIKRLGLSRKRKSSESVGQLGASTKASCEKNVKLDKEVIQATESETDNAVTVNHFDYKKELEALKIKISEKEEKLRTFQVTNKNILELEDLIKLWKTGCKNAYLEFMHLLRDNEPNINIKEILSKLGIWETIFKHFEHDSDIAETLDCS